MIPPFSLNQQLKGAFFAGFGHKIRVNTVYLDIGAFCFGLLAMSQYYWGGSQVFICTYLR